MEIQIRSKNEEIIGRPLNKNGNEIQIVVSWDNENEEIISSRLITIQHPHNATVRKHSREERRHNL